MEEESYSNITKYLLSAPTQRLENMDLSTAKCGNFGQLEALMVSSEQ